MSEIENTRQTLRAVMPIVKNWAYFDHAAVSPLPQPTSDALAKWLAEATHHGTTQWLEWARGVKELRATAANMIGAGTDEIALLPSTTAGINLVAEGMDWQSGDNVVTLQDEFPSNLYPWMHLERLGVECRRLPTSQGRLDLQQLAEACDSRTRVVSVSWVGYTSGCRRDVRPIADIAHEHGALMFLDAIQGLGVFPLNVVEAGVDCLAADGHKWMLGPEGAGIAYVSREWLPQLKPIGIGWNSVVNAAEFSHDAMNLKTTAGRYEGGTQNMAGFIALGESLKLLSSLGAKQIGEAILENSSLVYERLQEVGADIFTPRDTREESSGIISFDLPGKDLQQVRKSCLEHGVALACRGGRLRVSTHAYNNAEDVDRLVESLRML